MKNIRKLFTRLAALMFVWLAFGLVSCSNFMNLNAEDESDDVVVGSTGDSAQPAGYVKVLLGNISSRTILPIEWTEGAKKNLAYYLSGTGTLTDASSSTKTLAATLLHFDQITGSGETIELSPGTWSLTLNAYQLGEGEEPAATNMVLTATNTGVDLTATGSTETFALAPVTSTNATGSVDISGSVTASKYLKYIVQDVCTYSGSTFTSANSGAYKVTENVTTTTASATTSGVNVNFVYAKNVIAGANYWYVIDFYDGDPASGGQKLGHYDEALIVNGGNTSRKIIPLGDYLNSPAANPTKLWVTTSYDDTGLAANAATPNLFLAKFEWDDKAGNETGYELIIKKGTVSEGTTTYDTATYTIKKGEVTIGTAAGNVKTNSNAAGDADPTLGKNETACSVFLETGFTYQATIRAYNKYDENDASDTPTAINQVNSATSTGPFGMFTITYTLGDGNAKVMVDDTPTQSTLPLYVIGYNYSTEIGSLLPYVAASNSSTGYPYVTTGDAGMKWTKWITTVASQTSDEMDAAPAVTNIPANNITNLKLTGVWKSVATVTVTYPTYAALESAQWMTSYQIGSATAVPITSVDKVDISGTVGNVIKLTYDDSIVSGVTYRLVNGDASATATHNSTDHTITVDTGTLSEGTWYLTIYGNGSVTPSGGTEQAAQVSQIFAIKLN